jgi:hypothetical protein
MAWYKYDQFIKKSNGDAYDHLHNPGQAAPHSGIYRCEVCAKEVASNQNQPLPPQNHHQHPQQAPIKWRLIVYADHDPK